MSANASVKQLAAMTRFGRTLGLAFQVIDDILDVTQTPKTWVRVRAKISPRKRRPIRPSSASINPAWRRRDSRDRHTIRLSTFGAKAEALARVVDHLLQRDY